MIAVSPRPATRYFAMLARRRWPSPASGNASSAIDRLAVSPNGSLSVLYGLCHGCRTNTPARLPRASHEAEMSSSEVVLSAQPVPWCCMPGRGVTRVLRASFFSTSRCGRSAEVVAVSLAGRAACRARAPKPPPEGDRDRRADLGPAGHRRAHGGLLAGLLDDLDLDRAAAAPWTMSPVMSNLLYHACRRRRL